MHQVFSFLFKRNRSGHLAEKLLLRTGKDSLTLKRFYSYQYLIKEKVNSYVNGDAL